MKKTATGSFFVIPALLGLTVTQAQTVQTVKEPVLMSIIWTRRLNQQRLFRYVNGTWLDNTEIPSDRTRWEVLMN
jgi:predicted metalloendopeptidase